MTSAVDWRHEVLRVHDMVPKLKGRAPWDDDDKSFLANALAGEAGEVANLVKKAWRGDEYADTAQWREALRGEIADTRIYLELVAAAWRVPLGGSWFATAPAECLADTAAGRRARLHFMSLQVAGYAGILAHLAAMRWLSPDWDWPCEFDLLPRLQRGLAHEVERRANQVRVHLEALAEALGVDIEAACRDTLPKLWQRWPETAPAGWGAQP